MTAMHQTDFPEWARESLRNIRTHDAPDAPSLAEIAAHCEIYPGRKTAHFESIRKASGVSLP
jgi:hypothetical protein